MKYQVASRESFPPASTGPSIDCLIDDPALSLGLGIPLERTNVPRKSAFRAMQLQRLPPWGNTCH